MKTIVDYIEDLKEKYNLPSYFKAMQYIDMDRQAWTKIKNGGGISDKNALRLAKALKIEPLEIMAISNALKSKNVEIRTIWARLAEEKKK